MEGSRRPRAPANPARDRRDRVLPTRSRCCRRPVTPVRYSASRLPEDSAHLRFLDCAARRSTAHHEAWHHRCPRRCRGGSRVPEPILTPRARGRARLPRPLAITGKFYACAAPQHTAAADGVGLRPYFQSRPVPRQDPGDRLPASSNQLDVEMSFVEQETCSPP